LHIIISQKLKTLEKMELNLEQLKAKAAKSSTTIKAGFHKKIKQVEGFINLCKSTLELAGKQSEASAMEILSGMAIVWTNLAQSIQSAEAHIS